ncbi:MAG: nucleotidyl transferase AbiEii/AbiGii toxin family protein [Thiomonas sp.]
MDMTTHSDVLQFKSSGSWRGLVRVAFEMVRDAEQRAGVAMHPKLGGGTRLMLAFDHRISDDIDLFIRDPQWIGYLTPRLNDHFESLATGYEESASSLKLRLPGGEIDFIVSMSLLGLPDEHAADVPFALESVDEVLAKKLFYRGWALTPRDLFDWRAVVQHAPPGLVGQRMARLLVGDRLAAIRDALLSMKASRAAAAAWEAIRAPDKPALGESIAWALTEIDGYARPACA